jgi:hypothetical protein
MLYAVRFAKYPEFRATARLQATNANRRKAVAVVAGQLRHSGCKQLAATRRQTLS